MRKAIYSILFLFVIAFLVIGCTGKAPVQDDTQKYSVKIGGLFGLTGFAAFAGEAGRNGFIMAIEDSGMNIEYVIEDTNSDFKNTVTAAIKLLEVYIIYGYLEKPF